MHPKRAIVSVYDKSGLDELSKALQKHGIEIYATGGTGEYLKKHGIEFKSSEEYTGFVELLDGKVKTLNSKLHAAILGSVEELKKLGIKPIDMVVCNFYPLDFGIEGMDIGGPAMTRAAAKNWKRVVIVSSPSQYKEVIEHLEQGFDEDFRKKLAIEAIRRTAYYDAKLVEKYNEEFPNYLTLPFVKKIELRYGENPHQRGAFYVAPGNGKANIANAEQLLFLDASISQCNTAQQKKFAIANYYIMANTVIASFEKLLDLSYATTFMVCIPITFSSQR